MNAVWDEYHQIVFRCKHRANFLRKVRYDTLSNVETRRGEANPPSVRLAPDTIPEAKSSSTGVSVRYVPAPGKSWYVLLKDGEMVRVVDGMVKGVIGRVARVSGQQRVIAITNVGLVSTAYVPAAFIQFIEE